MSMRSTRVVTGLMAACALWTAAGCVSTPARRIAKEPDVFAAFPADVQERVRKGEVDVGFTRDMVRLALGAPSRVVTRRAAGGEIEIWLYTSVRYRTETYPVHSSYWYRGRNGRLYHAYDPGFVDVDTREEYPAMRVEFEGGKVRATERTR